MSSRQPGSDPTTSPSRGKAAGRWAGKAVGVVRPVFIDKVERDHRQSDSQFVRRRIVVAITLVFGSTLGLSFSTQQGDPMLIR